MGLIALWRRENVAILARAAVISVYLVLATLPLRSKDIEDHHLGEHRLAETLAIDLRWAGRGYWRGFPDARHVVNGPRIELLDALRAEISAGRLRADTQLLHIAASFQEWVATPVGVFTGINETVVSRDAEDSFHTVGGRLRHIERLDELLRSRAFSYVLLEPGEGVPSDAAERVAAAGFVSIFDNGEGAIFRAP
jgi:hypothetical protein